MANVAGVLLARLAEASLVGRFTVSGSFSGAPTVAGAFMRCCDGILVDMPRARSTADRGSKIELLLLYREVSVVVSGHSIVFSRMAGKALAIAPRSVYEVSSSAAEALSDLDRELRSSPPKGDVIVTCERVCWASTVCD